MGSPQVLRVGGEPMVEAGNWSGGKKKLSAVVTPPPPLPQQRHDTGGHKLSKHIKNSRGWRSFKQWTSFCTSCNLAQIWQIVALPCNGKKTISLNHQIWQDDIISRGHFMPLPPLPLLKVLIRRWLSTTKALEKKLAKEFVGFFAPSTRFNSFSV